MQPFNKEDWESLSDIRIKLLTVKRMYRDKIITQEEYKKYTLDIIGVKE